MTWNRRVTPEGQVKSACKQYLKLKGWFVCPIMQGPLSYRGISDFIAVKDGETVFIEIKAKTGRQSMHQLRFQDDIEHHGARYIIARSIDDLKDAGI